MLKRWCVFLAPNSTPVLVWTELTVTVLLSVQMATPGRRLCTSGRGAQWRLGTFAPGGSTSSPLWAWGTLLRLSGLSQVRKLSLIVLTSLCYFFLTHFVKADWIFTLFARWCHLICRVCDRSDFLNMLQQNRDSTGAARHNIHVGHGRFNLMESRAWLQHHNNMMILCNLIMKIWGVLIVSSLTTNAGDSSTFTLNQISHSAIGSYLLLGVIT